MGKTKHTIVSWAKVYKNDELMYRNDENFEWTIEDAQLLVAHHALPETKESCINGDVFMVTETYPWEGWQVQIDPVTKMPRKDFRGNEIEMRIRYTIVNCFRYTKN